MSDILKLEAAQIDALREVANIGAGHAATALSQMTDRTIMISVPEIKIARLMDVPDTFVGGDTSVIGVSMHMLGDLTGLTIMLLPDNDASLLCDLVLRKPAGTTVEFNELAESSLKEAGNIIGGAYMNALSEFMGMMLLPSVPKFVHDQASAALAEMRGGDGSVEDVILSVETALAFKDVGQELTAHFLLLPDRASLDAIFDAINVS
ncbi:MAG: chemotaxis protein CheC [Gemmatimonadota bacterium]|nr:chemotaxis protein CheC [Gemmatimonadota bacterium]MDH5803727.1 chemotaxis protein CheC [Gemmatimonadota bacterium]